MASAQVANVLASGFGFEASAAGTSALLFARCLLLLLSVCKKPTNNNKKVTLNDCDWDLVPGSRLDSGKQTATKTKTKNIKKIKHMQVRCDVVGEPAAVAGVWLA